MSDVPAESVKHMKVSHLAYKPGLPAVQLVQACQFHCFHPIPYSNLESQIMSSAKEEILVKHDNDVVIIAAVRTAITKVPFVVRYSNH